MRWNLAFILSMGLCVAGCSRGEKNSVTPESTNLWPAPTNRIVGIHFIGSVNAAKDTNSTFLKGIWALPQTQTLKGQTLDKLARVPFELASWRGTMSTNDFVAEIRPLMDDLVKTESWIELRDGTNPSPDFSLAVKLDAERAELWRTNIATALSAWSGIAVTQMVADGVSGWELKKHDPPNLIRFTHVGDWVVLSAGEDKISLADELVANIKSQGRPCPVESNDALTVEANLSRLAQIVPLPADLQAFHLTSVHGQWSIHSDHVRTEIAATRDSAFQLDAEPWHIPTNVVRGQVIGFTAVKGIGDWVADRFPRLKMSPMPGEFFAWTLKALPFQGFVAASVENASNALQQIGPQLTALNTNPPTVMPGNIEWQTNHEILQIGGLPYIAPFIQGLHATNGDFVLSGIFPVAGPRSQLPEALIEEILGQTNLVYYSWELTGPGLDGWRNISQLYLMIYNFRQLADNSASSLWIDAVSHQLGPAITEVTQTGTNELKFIRNSDVGFTSYEMIALANWLETPKFPLDKIPAPMERPKPRVHRAPKTSAPTH